MLDTPGSSTGYWKAKNSPKFDLSSGESGVRSILSNVMLPLSNS